MTDDQKLDWIAIRVAILAIRTGLHVNAPSTEGRQLGEQMARFADTEIAKRKLIFPNHVERCHSCAFRRGTTANQCGATLLNALSCLRGDEIFLCHEHKDHDCVGYSVLKHST